MDPLSIVTLVNASACLALKCGKVSTDLNTLINKYKRAELSILALSNECQTMRTVLSKIESAFNASDNDFPVDDDVLIQLDSSLNFGQMVISALEKDLAPLHDLENAEGFTKKSGIVFNDAILRTYKDHVRGQLLSLTCLLEVLKLSVHPCPPHHSVANSSQGHPFTTNERLCQRKSPCSAVLGLVFGQS
jgi:hypothetical protein